jgi:geranylgeranyl pyrophosphate synthase
MLHHVALPSPLHHFEVSHSSITPGVSIICGALVVCRDITDKHRRLAEITEMIHTASLMHDDVVDESPVRRGEDIDTASARIIQLNPLECQAATMSPMCEQTVPVNDAICFSGCMNLSYAEV